MVFKSGKLPGLAFWDFKCVEASIYMFADHRAIQANG
jgi:hypothetical protein